MPVTSSGIVTMPSSKAANATAMIEPESIKKWPSGLENLPLKDIREEHPPNAAAPILDTPSGMVMLVRFLQLEKA